MEKHRKKSIIVLTLFVLMAQMLLPLLENVSYATTVEEWDISENGDGSITATLDEEGTLTISGTGKMKNWSSSGSAPWNSVRNKIIKAKISEGVTSIGSHAFFYCTSLASITIPEGVTSIGNHAFSYCTSLESITIPEGVTSIGSYEFYNCTSLASITIPSSVTSIEDCAFYNCTSLESITIPSSITSIEDWAFCNCTSLANITIPEGVTSIGSYAFFYCASLASITIPEGVTSIEDCAFYNCTSLESITIPEGARSIGNYAFYNCTSLESITIPEGVTSIEDWAFKNCTSLASITIPEGVRSIGNYAFKNCTSLESITIPEGVRSIGSCAFGGCSSLTNIYVSEENSNYISVEGVLYTNNKRKLIQYPAGKKEKKYEISEGVTSIGSYTFYGCSSLASITIPEGVTSIEGWAFYNCTSLESITIPRSVTSIGDSAFGYCTSLASITIPEGVTSIGSCEFYNCTSLESITIPSSVTSIGSDAFYDCNKLNILCKSNSAAETYAKENSIKYTLDDIKPEVKFSTNGINTPSKIATTIVTVTDDLAGVNEKTLKYLWTTKDIGVEADEIKTNFSNGETISNQVDTGTYYLWIYAHDLVGNETIIRSNAFTLDNVAPTLKATYELSSDKSSAIVTITSNEKVQSLAGWTLSSDGKALTKKYTVDTTETITVKDLAGNESSIQIKVAGIEKYFQISDCTISEGKYIIGIEPNTSMETFKSKISTNKSYKIKDNSQEVTTGPVKTGQTIEVDGTETYILVVKGDSNGDGESNFKDLVSINSHRLNKRHLKGEHLLAADVNEDGVVDFKDMVKINKYRLHKIAEL